MEENNITNNEITKDELNEDKESINTDLSDIGLCTLNKYEYQYNVMLCHMFMGEYKTACEHATNIAMTASNNYTDKIWIIRAILLSLIGRSEDALADFEKAKLHDRVNAEHLLQEKKDIIIQVFPEQSRLCYYFPYVKFTTPQFPALIIRPSFSMPFVKPPGIIPYIDKSILNEFDYRAINCRPEAPWIKRYKSGFKFTDEIQTTLNSMESDSEHDAIYMSQSQYDDMKSECSRIRLKAKSQRIKVSLNNSKSSINSSIIDALKNLND